MVAAGVAFFYLVINLVSEAESTTPGLENTSSRKAREYAKYYQEDINGDPVLNFAGVPLAKAKDIWNESSIKQQALTLFPDFDSVIELCEGQLNESQFKSYLLKELRGIEGDFIDGSINLDQAKRRLEGI